ncbi:MAG: response regulator [Leptolyngbyaceae bacterium]|nr:response regulator [Leptolyngbyaceae bacterium]
MQTENVHLLIVEDNPRFLEELLQWLKEDYGYQHIKTATSASQAHEKLEEPFDVIIADMRMEQDDSGFAVVEEVKTRNLSSVVIILTANDTVTDCRTAFKMGAWDYISKNMRGNVFDVVHESIQEAIAYFNRWGNLQNQQWIEDNLADLERQYFGQYIAVVNQTVIDSAPTEGQLQNKIEERKLRRFLTTIRKIGDLYPIPELITQPESPRLEFKSTFQWDVRQNCQNKALRFSILKSVAAFLNTEGGTLVIGVEDNGNIFGLEKDLSLLPKANLDQFEQTLINLIIERLGTESTQFINIRFEAIDNKSTCAIDVRKGSSPTFIKGEKKDLEFYVRAGNTSRSLNMQEFYTYLQSPHGKE